MKDKCTGCGKYISICPSEVIKIKDNIAKTDRSLCTVCGKCIEICPTAARSIIGREVTAGEVFKEVALDDIFYKESGGGITLSGGEPFGQPQFSVSLRELCKNAGIYTTIDTSGYAQWDTLKKVLAHVDLVLYDFKHLDDSEHKKCTGISNKIILQNAKTLNYETKIPIIARIPVIPGYNDSFDNIKATARFIAMELDESIKVHLLPYHRLGEGKHEMLEQAAPEFSSTEPPPLYWTPS